MLNNCNGHGTCVNSTSTCLCFDGWGSPNDATFYRAPDCSLRSCPSDRAWADVPKSSTSAHQVMECSNRGVCDKTTGLCKCFEGFVGNACQRSKCPNDCSGHGVCVSMKQMARMSNALPLGPNTYYEGDEESTTWDEDKLYGCVCDSSWEVGLGDGQRQEPEWFGPDCSLRKFCEFPTCRSSASHVSRRSSVGHCPSADNPHTFRDETNCTAVTAKDSIYQGEAGNLCQVDCADQGVCDHKTGLCQCFDGMFGDDCSIIDPLAVYDYWKKNKASMFTSREKQY